MLGVQPITCYNRFCSGVGYSKCSELKNFPWGLKETVSSEKYILQPRAHNSILPMSVDTLPLTVIGIRTREEATAARTHGGHRSCLQARGQRSQRLPAMT